MDATGNGHRLYTVEQVAKLWCKSRAWIYKRIKEGKIKPVQLGREYRISQRELERIEEEGIGTGEIEIPDNLGESDD